MSTRIESQQPIDIQAVIAELQAIEPDLADQRKAAFRQVYPNIVEKLTAGVKEGKLVELLSRQGILKSRATFKKWTAELDEGREVVRVSSLRQSLQNARRSKEAARS